MQRLPLAALGAALIALGGCAAAPSDPYSAAYPAYGGPVVRDAPAYRVDPYAYDERAQWQRYQDEQRYREMVERDARDRDARARELLARETAPAAKPSSAPPLRGAIHLRRGTRKGEAAQAVPSRAAIAAA